MTSTTVFEQVDIQVDKPVQKPKLCKESTLVDVYEERKPGSLDQVFSKRIRALKKRLSKIEKYEQEPDVLNKDQLEAIAKKGEVQSLLKELEDLFKIVSVSEQEASRSVDEKKAELEKSFDAKVDALKKQAVADQFKYSTAVFRLQYALNYLLPLRLDGSLSITEQEFSALVLFRAAVSGVGAQSLDIDEFSNNASSLLDKYLQSSTSEYSQGVSFKRLGEIVEKIVNPAPVPSFVATEIVEENQTNGQRPSEINFINPSEVMGMFKER